MREGESEKREREERRQRERREKREKRERRDMQMKSELKPWRGERISHICLNHSPKVYSTSTSLSNSEWD